jgi:hypothetical protein
MRGYAWSSIHIYIFHWKEIEEMIPLQQGAHNTQDPGF